MAFSILQSSPKLQTGGTSVGHTWTTPPAAIAGRKIIVFVSAYGPPTSITVTDDAGNTYTNRGSPAGDTRVAIFDADITSAPNTTTITMSSASDTTANMIYVDGLLASGAYDGNGKAEAGGGAPHVLTPAGTLAQADNVQFTDIGGNGGAGPITLTPPTGFTLIVSELTNAFIQHASAYRVINTTTPGSSQWSSSAGLAADVLVAYKLATDVSVALTGLGITSAQGTPAAAITKGLTGISTTGSQGTLGKSVDSSLTGSSIASQQGTLTPETGVTLELLGLDLASAVGALAAAVDAPLSGQSVQSENGSLSPGSEIVLELSGLLINSEVGQLSIEGEAPVGVGRPGSEIVGGKQFRNFKPLLQRVLDAKNERRVRPEKDRAAGRAKAIENEAAALVMDDGGEAEFQALAERWAAENPVVPPALAGLDPTQLFMAQVAFRLQQQQLEEQARAMLEAQRLARIRRNGLLALLLAA